MILSCRVYFDKRIDIYVMWQIVYSSVKAYVYFIYILPFYLVTNQYKDDIIKLVWIQIKHVMVLVSFHWIQN